MSEPVEPNAWLLLAAGDSRQYGGNDGYDDQADAYYTWDSTVNNHARIRRGDRVALWDKERLLGISVVEDIQTADTQKIRRRCRACGRANIKARKGREPLYRCQSCGAEFDEPIVETIDIRRYTSRHDAAWTALDTTIDGDRLRALCVSPRSQLSMRPLKWVEFRDELAASGIERALARVLARAPEEQDPMPADDPTTLGGGHSLATVRVRRGQQKFREHLLAVFGERCAFTNETPTRALEAGHLYSYAALGEHHRHGGLLLRRDIHRLFDDGLLAVDPTSLTADVAPSLEPYPQYSRLHGEPLSVPLRDQQVEWLEKHWVEHRS
ncbi:HNH endonuclease signature motif containing protein [Demequina sp. NBRC 110052]|uniref:HNH endonuclease signature motif containing protein n=1 Tax=Demequina sp. NBRC 110052 TaxID=1570341 RepID=UPI0011810F19|nr:HNH endonuclease signature motif containing protein [Demequina sp. NBRC 110052]